MTKRVYSGKKCGAKTRAGTPCKRPSGWGTDHVGEGRCKLHGGASPIKGGRYSTVKRAALRQLIESHAGDPDPLDVLPEIAAARALFQDFVERYDEWREAFLDWHASFATGDGPKKPREVLDLADGVRHLSTIATIAQREKKLQLDNAISRKDLLRVLGELTRVVDREVEDAATKKRIKDGWAAVQLA